MSQAENFQAINMSSKENPRVPHIPEISGLQLGWEVEGSRALPLRLIEHVANLTRWKRGLDPQTYEALEKRILAGDAVIAFTSENGVEEFLGYQSLPRKYTEHAKVVLSSIYGIYKINLPAVEIREWSTGVTNEDYYNMDVNTYLKGLLEEKKVREQNGIPILTMVEVWNFVPASLSVNLRKNGMHPVDALTHPFAFEFMANLPFVERQGVKNLGKPPRRLVGEELIALTTRIAAGEHIPEEEKQGYEKSPGLILMASDMKLVEYTDEQLRAALSQMTSERKRELAVYLEESFPEIYTSILSRYSKVLPEADWDALQAMVGGLIMYSASMQGSEEM